MTKRGWWMCRTHLLRLPPQPRLRRLVNNNEGVGAGARQPLPNARRHQGFRWSSLEKQASLKKKRAKLSPRALLHPAQVLGRTGQRLTGGSSQMRPTQHR